MYVKFAYFQRLQKQTVPYISCIYSFFSRRLYISMWSDPCFPERDIFVISGFEVKTF